MSGPYDLDPGEVRVRSLIRRSDGPVLIRPFRHERARSSALPVMAGAAALLVLGLVVGTSLAIRRQEVASPPVATGALAVPTATHTPATTATAVPSPTPSAPGVPVSAGAVPAAGVLYLIGSDDLTYRYDGATGMLTAITARSTFVREVADGVVSIGRDGAASVLRWDGTTAATECGTGTDTDVSPSGACVHREADDSVTISLPGDTSRLPLAAGWSVTGALWDNAGSRLAFVRALPGPTDEDRAHNSLWLREADGTLREMYEPATQTAFATMLHWSPDGRSIAAVETPYYSSSLARDGAALMIIDVASGESTALGTVVGLEWIAWSHRGELAFVRGAGRETWYDKRLVVRAPDGTEREIALPDDSHVQIAPAWSASGDLAFVVGPSSRDGDSYDTSTYMDGTGLGDRRGMVLRADGSTREIRCPDSVVEGIRPSGDGRSFLLLCRTPGDGGYPLSIWFLGPGTETPVALVHGLGQSADAAGGFGYYGKHPHLELITAWSLAAR